MTTWTMDGLVFRRYEIPGMPVFWWLDTQDGGLMAFCPGEILLHLYGG